MTAAAGPAWRRLNPRMLLVHPVREIVRNIPALLGILIAGTTQGQGPLWGLIGVALAVAIGTSRWFTTKYRILPDQVELHRGLLRRRTLNVPLDRVRSVDVTANVMHRILGLAKVQLGTGRTGTERGGREGAGGLTLDALTASDASSLREELLHRQARPTGNEARNEAGAGDEFGDGFGAEAGDRAGEKAVESPSPGQGPSPAAEQELARFRLAWIGYGPFTLSGLITVAAIVGIAGRILNETSVDPSELDPLRWVYNQIAGGHLAPVILILLVILLVLAALSSTIGYVLAFWNFRLQRHPGGTLHISRGLLTTRATSLEERRLRGVELSEPLLLRMVRGARCLAIATGLRVGRGADRGASLLLPPAPRRETGQVAEQVLTDADPVRRALASHGPRARRRRFSRAFTVTVPIILAAGALGRFGLVPGWLAALSPLLLAVAAALALDRSRSLGHALTRDHLVARLGSVVRRRSILAKEGIIGWNLHQSFFQRRAGLATLVATTAAGRQAYRIQDVPLNTAIRVADEAVPGLLTPFLQSPEAVRESAPTAS